MRIAVTGGVGSGKSTVAGMLAGHGAHVVDADVVAREVVAPGSPGLAAVVQRFGERVLDSDGALDRAALAATIFGDDGERAALNAIVHPLVHARSDELVAAAGPDAVVVQDIPLLAETGGSERFDLVIVVEAPLPARLARLERRGMAQDDARQRIAAQATDSQRRALADEVVVNDSSRAALQDRVDAVWLRITQLAEQHGGRGSGLD